MDQHNTIFIAYDKVSANTASYNVTKNLTGHRLHVTCPQIYQMDRQINSFQNMCDLLQAKIDRLANGKSILCKSNTSKLPFLVDTNLGYLSLEGPGRRTANG